MKRSPIAKISPKKRREAKNRAVIRLEVFTRDDFKCRMREVYGVGRCWGPPTFQHVLKASQGGTYTADNGVTLCSWHNDLIEADADVAKIAESLGLAQRKWPA